MAEDPDDTEARLEPPSLFRKRRKKAASAQPTPVAVTATAEVAEDPVAEPAAEEPDEEPTQDAATETEEPQLADLESAELTTAEPPTAEPATLGAVDVEPEARTLGQRLRAVAAAVAVPPKVGASAAAPAAPTPPTGEHEPAPVTHAPAPDPVDVAVEPELPPGPETGLPPVAGEPASPPGAADTDDERLGARPDQTGEPGPPSPSLRQRLRAAATTVAVPPKVDGAASAPGVPAPVTRPAPAMVDPDRPAPAATSRQVGATGATGATGAEQEPAWAYLLDENAPQPEPAAPVVQGELEAAPSRAPWLTGWLAVVVTGLVAGILVVILTVAGEHLCTFVRGTSSCGGAGLLLLIAILIVAVVVGNIMLRTAQVPEPASTSVLAVGLLSVLILLFLVGSIFSWWMIIAIPLLSIAAFSLSHWVTTAVVSDDLM